MAFRLMGNREEAEDIVQEVYLKLWGMRSDLPEYKSIEALSIRITRNLCLDQLRRRKTTLEVMKEQQATPRDFSRPPDQLFESNEKAEIIHSLVDALPEPQKSLVYLRHLEEKDYEEISEMMNMNVNAIRVSISRARKQMREMLEKKYSSWKV